MKMYTRYHKLIFIKISKTVTVSEISESTADFFPKTRHLQFALTTSGFLRVVFIKLRWQYKKWGFLFEISKVHPQSWRWSELIRCEVKWRPWKYNFFILFLLLFSRYFEEHAFFRHDPFLHTYERRFNNEFQQRDIVISLNLLSACDVYVQHKKIIGHHVWRIYTHCGNWSVT